MRAILAVAFFALFPVIAPAVAAEQVDICAQYTSTGKSYHVTATSETGAELNQATQTFNYNSFGQYIVIFWTQNQASVIEMLGVFGGPTYIPNSGTDQEGRTWQISAYTPVICGGFQ